MTARVFLLCAALFLLLTSREPPWADAHVTYDTTHALAMLWLVERTLSQAERPTHAGMGWLGVAAGVLFNSKLVYALVFPAVAIYLLWARRQRLGDLLSKTPLALVAFGEFALVALF